MGLFQQPSYPQTTTQQSTQQQQLSPAQQKLVDTSANFLTGQVGTPSQAYPGPMVAPLTPAQGEQVSNAVALGNQSYVPQQQGMGALGAYASGAYLNDPFLAAQLGATTQQAEQQFAASIPQLRAPFIQAGQTGFSSPELAALYGASANFATGLQKNLADQAAQNYLGEQALQLQAAPQAVQAGGAVQAQAAQMAALPQQTQQAQFNAAMQDWLRQLSGAWAATGVPAFGEIATAGAPTTTQGTTTAPPLYGPSPFQSILGGLGQFAGPAAYFFRPGGVA
jgi:hypothetical protein